MPRTDTPKLELVGLAELAELLGLTRLAVSTRRSAPGPFIGDRRARLPAPLAELKCGPIWTREQIEAYRADEERQLTLDISELFRLHRKEGRELPPRAR
jgi:hypothetical protein